MSVPEDVGCKNSSCIKTNECNRAKIYKENRAREVKSFGGTPDKGCGKFIPIKESDGN
jgi:hypothetical protein